MARSSAPSYQRVRRDTAPGWLLKGWAMGEENRAGIGRRRRATHLKGLDERVAATIRPRQKQRRKR